MLAAIILSQQFLEDRYPREATKWSQLSIGEMKFRNPEGQSAKQIEERLIVYGERLLNVHILLLFHCFGLKFCILYFHSRYLNRFWENTD